MVDTKTADEVGGVGGVAGLVVGLLSGAKAGSLFLPIPVVGTFTGAVIGGVVGSGAGRFLAQVLLKVGDGTLKAVSNVTSGATAS